MKRYSWQKGVKHKGWSIVSDIAYSGDLEALKEAVESLKPGEFITVNELEKPEVKDLTEELKKLERGSGP